MRGGLELPSPDRIEVFAQMVAGRQPEVQNIIGFVDGLSIPCECADDEQTQNAYYNGYHHDSACNNVLAFSPEGKVMFACINAPGSWHDSQVCMELMNTVLETIGTYALCVDQGFKRSGVMHDQRRNLSEVLRDALLARHGIYFSLRQAAEWGMRAL
jgi:hypothetical protein